MGDVDGVANGRKDHTMHADAQLKINQAAKDVADAKAELAQIEGNSTMPAAALAQKRLMARELVAVAVERHTLARERLAAEQAAERATRIANYKAEGAALRAKAEHALRSATGQLIGLFGEQAAEALLQTGRKPSNVIELERLAANAEGMAEQLEAEK